MNVLITGHDNPISIANSYVRAFRELGAKVKLFCLKSAYDQAFLGSQTRIAKRLLGGMIAGAFNRKVRSDLSNLSPDLILVIKGQHLSSKTIDTWKDRFDAPIVNFYPDDPFSDVRSNRLTYGPDVLSSYTACFTFAKHLIPRYQEAGAQNVFYLPFARDPHLHKPPNDSPHQTPYDVIFVGNLDETRVKWLEPLAESEYCLAICGERTKEAVPYRSALRGAEFMPAAHGGELAQALHRGAVSINIMRRQNEGSHNMRSFESPACGAFTLSQRTPELVDLFAEDEEIACFSSPEELREKVGYWLAHPAERQQVARNGFQRVKDDTYQRRATTILDALNLKAIA